MRIGTKLLLVQLAALTAIFTALTLGLPRLVNDLVIVSARQELTVQAERLASEILHRPRSLPALTALVDRLVANARMLIVDRNGVILAASDRALERRPFPGPVPYRRALAGKTMVTDLTDAGPSLAVSVPLFEGYQLVLVRPLHELASFAQPIARRLLIILAVGAALATATTLLLSRNMVARLKRTGAAASSLAAGDLTSRAPAAGADEIAEMGRHFNHMAERLQAVVEGLRKSERLRRELLVNVGHELRTPMTSIQGFAEALRDGVVRDEMRRQRYYEIIAQEAGRLSRLTQDLFDVARFEAGQTDLRLQEMAITPWLVGAAEQARQLAEPHNVQVTLQVGPGVEGAHLYGDTDRLNQVMTNLVQNAIRYSPSGATIRIEARFEGAQLRVSVRDQGPGLAPDEADKVFDRFYQGPTQSARAHKGAGLGLAIVRSVVEAHSGTVGVDAAPDQGATFWFQIPSGHEG